MANNPAVFLDRDGTIIEDIGYIKDSSDIVFYPDTLKALTILQKHYLLFIITNQSGIAKGLTTFDEVDNVNNFIKSFLRSEGINIYDIFCCPHKSEDNCECKKPKPYFIHKAAQMYNLKLSDSVIIGDHPSDAQCGINAGVTPVYVLTGHGKKHINELTAEIKICENILDAANYIMNSKNSNHI